MDVPDGRDLVGVWEGSARPRSIVGTRQPNVLQTTDALNNSGALGDPIVVEPDADPTATAETVTNTLIAEGWTQLESSVPAFQQAGAAASVFLEESGAMANGEFQVVNVFDRGGERGPQWLNGSLDFLAFIHEPHYALVEVAPLIEQRVEPGRAPARPEIDTDRRVSTCT
jgi:hypothetical protein